MARCGACDAELEGTRQSACPTCGTPRLRPVTRSHASGSEDRRGVPSDIAVPSHASEFIRIAPRTPSTQDGVSQAPLQDPTVGRRSSVVGTVMAAILIGAVILGAGRTFLEDVGTIPQRLLVAHALTVGLYVFVALLVRSRLSAGDVRPDFAVGRDASAVGFGALTGLGGGVLIVGLNSLAAGKLGSDPNMVGVVYERQWVHIGIAIAIAVIAAPLVEEFLFRGLLVESLRSRGRNTAILAGAVAFSLWHLNPSALRYYVMMGFFLGLLYWRFGINGSITAHAVFNATLIVCAFAVVSTGPEQLTSAGITVHVPGGWTAVEDEKADKGGLPADLNVDVALRSPTGAVFLVQHVDVPDRGFVMQDLGAGMPRGAGAVRRVTVSGTQGTRYTVPNPEGDGSFDTIAIPRNDRVFIVVLGSGGSEQAGAHLEAMLGTLSLPR